MWFNRVDIVNQVQLSDLNGTYCTAVKSQTKPKAKQKNLINITVERS